MKQVPDFDRALRDLMDLEGIEFTDHEEDRGGATKFGVTQGTLERYRISQDTIARFPEHVSGLTLELASEIAEEMFWKLSKADCMPDHRIAFELFEQMYHIGNAGTAGKILQLACNTLRPAHIPALVVDGKVGPRTVGAVNNLCSKELYVIALLKAINSEQYIYLKLGRKLWTEQYLDISPPPAWRSTFLRGWMRRIGI